MFLADIKSLLTRETNSPLDHSLFNWFNGRNQALQEFVDLAAEEVYTKANDKQPIVEDDSLALLRTFSQYMEGRISFKITISKQLTLTLDKLRVNLQAHVVSFQMLIILDCLLV